MAEATERTVPENPLRELTGPVKVVEAIANNKGEEQIVKEMADVIIRLCDLWAGMNHDGVLKIQLEQALKEKAEFNKTRPRMHGKLA